MLFFGPTCHSIRSRETAAQLKLKAFRPIYALNGRNPQARSVSDQPNSEEIFMSTSAVSSVSLNQQLQSYFQTRNSDVQQLGQALSSGNLANAQVAYNSITALGQEGPFANGNPFQLSQREQDFTAIGQALQSGDLAGAQQAFSALQLTFRGNTPKGPTAQPVSSSAAGVAATGAGSAGPEIVLNLSGNSGGTSPTTAASTAPEIVINLSNSGGSSPAAPAAASSTTSPEIVLNLNSSSTSPEEITIGIANSGGGEQVSISVGAEGSTNQGSTNQASNAPQVTLNLGANTNEQIVLNFLNALSSTTSTSSTSGSSANSGVSVSA
jgi:hypothetical protein